MSTENLFIILSSIALACAGTVLALSVWLFWQKNARSDRWRNVVLLISFLCLTALRVVDLVGGLFYSPYSGRSASYPYSNPRYYSGYESRVARLLASAILGCIFTNTLLFVYTRMMLSLLYRPDLVQQTIVYRRLRAVVYSCYAFIVALAIGATCAWIYMLAAALNSSISTSSSQGAATLIVRAVLSIISLLYTLALAIITCLISHDARFSTGTMTLYQFSLTAACASFIFAIVLDFVVPDFSYSTNANSNHFILEFADEGGVYDYIRSMVTAFQTLLLPFVLTRGFTKRRSRGRLSRWRRTAFGDAGPPYTTSDVESGSTSSASGPVAEKARAAHAVEVDSSPISEAAGRARAELAGEGPAELPADVEIAEMEAGKAPGESAYVKATKGYDAEVLESAEERAKIDAEEARAP